MAKAGELASSVIAGQIPLNVAAAAITNLTSHLLSASLRFANENGR